MMKSLFHLLAATSILAHYDDLYRCEKCGQMLILTNDTDCPWEMKDGKWTHQCNEKEIRKPKSS